MLVTEGDGARMFPERRKLKRGRLERMIASPIELVYQDKKHFHFYKEAARAVESKQDLAHQRSSAPAGQKTRCFILRQNWGSLILDMIGALSDIRAILA